MKKATGTIIITGENVEDPEYLLKIEQYLNEVINNIMYANLGVGIRVHLD